MRMLVLSVSALALVSCNQAKTPEADTAGEANAAVAETEAPAEFSMNETSWEHTQDGRPMRTSIDASGNYETVSGEEHIDHGSFEMVDGRACFTSAMNQDGRECWTVAPIEIGESMESSSDKGKKLTVTRRDYTPFEART